MVGSLSISLQCICSVPGQDIRSCPQCLPRQHARVSRSYFEVSRAIFQVPGGTLRFLFNCSGRGSHRFRCHGSLPNNCSSSRLRFRPRGCPHCHQGCRCWTSLFADMISDSFNAITPSRNHYTLPPVPRPWTGLPSVFPKLPGSPVPPLLRLSLIGPFFLIFVLEGISVRKVPCCLLATNHMVHDRVNSSQSFQ